MVLEVITVAGRDALGGSFELPILEATPRSVGIDFQTVLNIISTIYLDYTWIIYFIWANYSDLSRRLVTRKHGGELDPGLGLSS